ncbi:MAG: class I SAM-dependent methyltransferase [Nitrospirota bacterium]
MADKNSVPIVMEYVPCVLCGSEKNEVVLSGHDRLYGIGGEYNLVRCGGCGLCFVNPRPDKTSLQLFYPETYLVEGENLSSISVSEKKKKAMDSMLGFEGAPGIARIVRNFGDYLRIRRDYRLYSLMFVRRGRLLDVGCGNGRFITFLKKNNWDAAGVEVHDDTIKHLARKEGLEVYTGDFLELDIPKVYDIITMWWVLEHAIDPLSVLKKARGLLADDGNMIVAVPNFDCIERKVFGGDWALADLPRHLYNFTPRTINGLFAKAGFKVVRRIDKSFPAWSRDTWGYHKESSGKTREIGRFERRVIRFLSVLTEALNSGSGMIFIIKKDGQ